MSAPTTEREEFEAFIRERFPAAPLTRHPFEPERYDGVLAAWTWEAWQAARRAEEPLLMEAMEALEWAGSVDGFAASAHCILETAEKLRARLTSCPANTVPTGDQK